MIEKKIEWIFRFKIFKITWPCYCLCQSFLLQMIRTKTIYWVHHTICPWFIWTCCQDSGEHIFDAFGRSPVFLRKISQGSQVVQILHLVQSYLADPWSAGPSFISWTLDTPSYRWSDDDDLSAYNSPWHRLRFFLGFHVSFTFGLTRRNTNATPAESFWAVSYISELVQMFCNKSSLKVPWYVHSIFKQISWVLFQMFFSV